jgi:hypothetical protein
VALVVATFSLLQWGDRLDGTARLGAVALMLLALQAGGVAIDRRLRSADGGERVAAT